MERTRTPGRRAALMVALTMLAACGSGPVPSVPPSVVPSPSIVPSGMAPIMPPQAALLSVGAQPVLGQLGTYFWGDDGSSSPWLPGTPVTVPDARPLRFGLSVAMPVRRWTAQYAPAADGSPSRLEALDAGEGPIELLPPGPGEWTLELFVVYGPGPGGVDLGEAAYFWRMTVR